MSNAKGGKNHRRGKNHQHFKQRDLPVKEDQQEYATVIKMMGCGRVEAKCYDGKTRTCKIRGKMMNKSSERINPGDLILISLRDMTNDAKADVILKYTNEEIRALKSQGQCSEQKDLGQDENDCKEEDLPFDFESI